MAARNKIAPNFPDWGRGLFDRSKRYMVLYGGRASGKALRDDTPIATPGGWSEIGSLRVGDYVFAHDGRPTRVEGVYPQGELPEWRVDFRMGESLYASGDHLWVTETHNARERASRAIGRCVEPADWSVSDPLTTEQIRETLRRPGGERRGLNHSVHVCGELALPERELPIHPYVLGCWLGDGVSSQAALTVSPRDVGHFRARFAECGESLDEATPSSANVPAPKYPITKGRFPGDELGFRWRLQKNCLLGNKHIPAEYLRASTSQRLELLAGLMDTDGCIVKGGSSAKFSSTLECLSRGVVDLVQSLGWRCSIKRMPPPGDRCNEYWLVIFFPFEGCVSLPRKVARVREHRGGGRDRSRMITAVEPTGATVPMTCIAVASPQRLFLAGRSLIPTHNTWATAAALVKLGYENPMRIACVREFQRSISFSSKWAIEGAIHRHGLGGFYDIKRDWISGKNGTFIFFAGLSSATQEQIRGMESVDIVWVEEAQRMTIASREILYPTIRKPGSQLWFTFNPRYRSDPVWMDFCSGSARETNAYVKKINFMDNRWLSPESDEERRNCLEDEPDRYPHIWLGEPDDEGEAWKVLPYGLLQECVDAWPKRTEVGRAYVGLDVADSDGGGDKNALALRKGPCLMDVVAWHSSDQGATTRRADRWCAENDAAALYFDTQGVGAGVREALRSMPQQAATARGVHFGGAVTGPEVPYVRNSSNKDHFSRHNAQLAFAVRNRALKTRRLMMGEDINPERCFFINPKIRGLEKILAIMSQPVREEDMSGRVRIDKTPDDAPSPDEFDAALLAFAHDSRFGLRLR